MMAKGANKAKKQANINVNWKKLGISLSLALNVIVIGGVLTLFVWYKTSPGSFALDLWSKSHSIVCEDLGQEAMKEIRKNATANRNVNDKEFAPAVSMVCSLDYQTGNLIGISDETRASIYKDILEARNQ